ncbi:MAG: tRNA (cytidine(56)-2'-O)-methyltransferase [Candidatus Micrarchaeota archaeon]
MPKIIVLRLGHRKKRDVRATTHCCLAARALGANEIILSGEFDETPIETARGVTKKWGGAFQARFQPNWLRFLRNFRGTKIHLTMYGLPLQEKIGEIRRAGRKKNVLVVIGAEKVPRAVYDESDYNVSIGGQPHSEVAALAVFLHEFFEGRELGRKFGGARIEVMPNARGKTVSKKKKTRKPEKRAEPRRKTA